MFFGIVYSDSKIYIALTRYFQGITTNPPVGWLSSRPLIPFLVSPLAQILDMPVAWGIVNTFFWIGSTFLMYLITLYLTSSRYAALSAAILLTSPPPALLYYGSVMLESGSTFFTLLILWLYLKFHDDRRLMFVTIVVGAGILAKESTLPALASIIIMGLLNREHRKVVKFTLLLIIPVIVWQTYTTVEYGENYVTHYLRAGLGYSQTRYGTPFYSDLIDILKAFVLGHFPLAIAALLIGFINTADRKLNLTFYALLIPALASYIAWPFRDLRIAVVSYYATMPIAGIGLEEIAKSLANKPLLNKLESKILRVLLYIVNILASVLYVYTNLGRLSPPWDIYLFAPSSLKEGL